MTYVIYMKNRNCISNREYFGMSECGKSVNGYHNPRYANEFKSKDEALAWSEKYNKYHKYSEKVNVKAIKKTSALKHYDNFPDELYRSFDVPNFKYDRPFNKEKDDSLESVLDWWIGKGWDDNIRYENHKTWPNLAKYLNNIYECRFSTKNYKEHLCFFNMYVRKKDSFNVFEKEFNMIKDKTKLEKDGYLLVDIFEHTLSESGSWYFYYKSDMSHFKFMRTSYGSSRPEYECDNLKDAFLYWQDNLYYD